MITGKDSPDSGSINVGETVRMVSVGQDRMDQLDSKKTVFEEISSGLDEIELGTNYINSRAYCSWFGFKSGQQQAFVGNLSGGERNRVQLAKLLKTGANLIILDEVRVLSGIAKSYNDIMTNFSVFPISSLLMIWM
jgi:sulfate-transporting ATPase